MSIRKKGFTGLRVVSTERTFDEATGFQTAITYEGFEQAVDAAMGVLSTQGGVRLSSKQQNGPWYSFTATSGGTADGTSEGAVDTWSRVTEFAQDDIRNNPNVVDAAGASSSLAGAQLLALWVKEIKEAIKNGEPLDGLTTATQDSLYELYARGADSYEVKRIVVRRRRIIPVDFADRSIVRATELIYTTAQLVNTFEVPAAFAALLPANPAKKPNNTMWGWRERANTTDFIPSLGKVEEAYEWAFAAWSTVLYDAAS